MNERYGAPTTLQSPRLKEHVRSTMQKRYGVDFPMQSTDVKSRFDFKAAAIKRHATMKEHGSYKQSQEEQKFGLWLESQWEVTTHVVVNSTWPIDFYLPKFDLYLQFDGVYWHGLDRPIAEIRASSVPRDRVIARKWQTDRDQEVWFANNGMCLLRIRSDEFDGITCSRLLLHLEAF